MTFLSIVFSTPCTTSEGYWFSNSQAFILRPKLVGTSKQYLSYFPHSGTNSANSLNWPIADYIRQTRGQAMKMMHTRQTVSINTIVFGNMGEFVVISATMNLDSYKRIIRPSKSHNTYYPKPKTGKNERNIMCTISKVAAMRM